MITKIFPKFHARLLCVHFLLEVYIYYFLFLQTMFGQKYGYRPFPAVIGADEFEMLNGALLQAQKDTSLLRQWFRKDENRIPPVYSLVPISSRIPDYVNKVSANLDHQHSLPKSLLLPLQTMSFFNSAYLESKAR